MNPEDRLPLPDPLPGLWQLDRIYVSGQPGAEIVHACASRLGLLMPHPGVSGMVTKVFRKLKAFNTRRRQFRPLRGAGCGRVTGLLRLPAREVAGLEAIVSEVGS